MNGGGLTILPVDCYLSVRGLIALPHTEVHLWGCHLEPSATTAPRCSGLLNNDELSRAAGYHFARDRDRFIVARTFVRSALSWYTGIGAADLAFDIAVGGKPRLASAVGSHIEFNFSDSHEHGVLVVSRSEVGVDIEKSVDMNYLGVADQFFCASERQDIGADSSQVRQRFFDYWVAKEAVIKAQGTGLQTSLREFAITEVNGELRACPESGSENVLRKEWRVERVRCDVGWHCAVAAAGDGWHTVVCAEPPN
jgi:4'-phosphopantetheinyl transferase